MQYTRRDVVAGLPVLMAFGLAGCKTAKATANNTTEATKKASEALRITAAQTLDGYAVNSTTADENTILVNTTDDVTITNSTVTKTGDSDGGDNCNFWHEYSSARIFFLHPLALTALISAILILFARRERVLS